MNQAKKLSGVALATAAAALVLSGCASNAGSTGGATKTAKVHCSGINACKGHSACQTATSACKGQNSCKGKGWVSTTKAECDAKGGKVI